VKRWTIAACAIALFFFVLSLNAEVYEFTSPSTWSWHIAVRKIYSIVAFSIVGYAARRAFDEQHIRRLPWVTMLTVALYSSAIEGAQAAMGSHEGLEWNAIDIACGALGGAIGHTFARVASL
jgi:hypothetical protein